MYIDISCEVLEDRVSALLTFIYSYVYNKEHRTQKLMVCYKNYISERYMCFVHHCIPMI